VSHCSSEDLRVHSRNLEVILLVTVPGAVLARQCLPSSVCHYLSTSRMRGGASVLANHLLLVENLHGACELHEPWPGDTLDPVL
jgi:hypothetical protein